MTSGSSVSGSTATGVVDSLYVYPVKGLSPEPLDSVRLIAGEGFPGDREWALARADGVYRPGTRKPVPKDQFHVLVRDDRLAGVRTTLREGRQLSVGVGGHTVLDADLESEHGRERTGSFFARMLDLPAEQAPTIARESGRRFTDVSVVSDAMMNAVSVINLASVRALEERSGTVIDPLRFRANIYVDGLPAFSELNLVGTDFVIGEARFTAVLNTGRCAATEVNPADARRDIPVPRLLVEHFGHSQMGFYGEVTQGGTIRPGDAVEWTTGQAG